MKTYERGGRGGGGGNQFDNVSVYIYIYEVLRRENYTYVEKFDSLLTLVRNVRSFLSRGKKFLFRKTIPIYNLPEFETRFAGKRYIYTFFFIS